MKENVLILTDGKASPANGHIAKLLRFFGVAWREVTSAEFLAGTTPAPDQSSKFRLFCSADTFLNLVADKEGRLAKDQLRKSVHSVFVYAGEDPEVLQELATRLAGNQRVAVQKLNGHDGDFVVTNELDEFCGVMAGVRIAAFRARAGGFLVINPPPGKAANIISTASGSPFLKFECHGLPVFLSTGSQIVDLDAELATGIFDIRAHLLSALPVVLYIKWALAQTCWNAAEANACLVIDDPVLKPTYGFIDFQKLHSLMKVHNFSTNIAFIPWNWRRSSPEVARLFRENPKEFSLSVHGCDHTRAEFGSRDQKYLYWKARQGLERMNRHEAQTGIPYDPVMVFPQGVFSEAAMGELRHTGFIAAVSNDTISADPHPCAIRISDVWDVAIMDYSNFPLFTRRYPWEGVENYAFDILLGKPSIVLIHHDFCRDDYQQLIKFIDQVNALKCPMAWRSLGEVVRRSCRQRELSPDTVEVEMYGMELRVKNRSGRTRRFRLTKRKSDPSIIKEVRAGLQPVEWTFAAGRIHFEIELKPEQEQTISISFRDASQDAPERENLHYHTKTMLRRYLSEVRDNYWMKYRKDRGINAQDEGFAPEPGSEIGIQKSSRHPGRRHSSNTTRAQSTQKYDLIVDRLPGVLNRFAAWLEGYGETSWDHQSFFAGPLGGRAKALYYRQKLVGTAAVAPMIFCEAFLPAARRLFHHPIRFPIADAHYAMGFSFWHEATGQSAHLEKAVHFLDELKKSRCHGFKEYCWGYPFDWVTRGGLIKEQTPLITSTPYVYEAFLHVFEIAGRPGQQANGSGPSSSYPAAIRYPPEQMEEWRQILASIIRHVTTDIQEFKVSDSSSSCSYTPYDKGGVINAAAYRAFVLTSASRVFANDDYWKAAERNLNFVLENQNADGSWFYAVDGVRDFVDHFHTCFVMKSLAKIHSLTGHAACGAALARGVDYYLKNLFAEDGLPKPFSKAPRQTVYKRELYDCAECINLCLRLRDRFPQLNSTLETVVVEILQNWVKPDGSFRSRQLHFGWDNVPMHRWAQSQIFRCLAFYLRELSADGTRRRAGGEAPGHSGAGDHAIILP